MKKNPNLANHYSNLLEISLENENSPKKLKIIGTQLTYMQTNLKFPFQTEIPLKNEKYSALS